MTEGNIATSACADDPLEDHDALSKASGESFAPPRAALPIALGASALALTTHPFGARGLLAAFVSAVLVMLAACDIQRRLIPNRIVLPATGVVLAAQLAIAPSQIGRYVAAALVSAFIMFLPRLVSRSAIGMGDVKLTLFLGASLGWSVMLALMLGFLCMFPVALYTLIRGGLEARKTALPFAPFLAAGGLLVILLPSLHGALL